MNNNRTIDTQNLSALQRLDNKIYGVLGTSTHVSVYIFDDSSKQWARKEVEGTLFVVARNEYPWSKLIVMNRLSTKNLVEEVNEKLVIKCQGQYLIYKNNNEINGIWFYETEDQDKIFKLLKEIQNNPPIPPQQAPQPIPPQPPMGLPPMGFPGMMHHDYQGHPPPFPGMMPFMGGPPPGFPLPPGFPPMVSPQKELSNTNLHNIPPPQPTQPQPSHNGNSNNVPIMLATLMNSVKNTPSSSSNTITKEQLKEKLKELVNDDNFINLVYQSYINTSHINNQ
ncbi:hypothetical protein DLAC_04675 [Tieghemostelium lacteum]|uniref:Uncharacterized protein n=1 Tax=Tieghemostelium lacteum TaxID=361077 RepID=A0A151ZKB6_TIELA|nr:hypothetical protein DLAC_04675 [Tieghemostelium lacteum]|eukprot:KYQ94377.1 hypothetical protein DLAC_04675 [Tieghemostelium lacteum]